MKEIKVDAMFECPFQHEEYYEYSEYTSGTDTKCTILEDGCWQKNCPLKAEEEIKVTWAVEEDDE